MYILYTLLYNKQYYISDAYVIFTHVLSYEISPYIEDALLFQWDVRDVILNRLEHFDFIELSTY